MIILNSTMKTQIHIKEDILRKAFNYWLINNENIPLESISFVYREKFEWWIFNILNSAN